MLDASGYPAEGEEMSKQTEALKLALEALEETRNALAWFYDSYPQDVTKKGNELLPHVETVLAAIREALAEHPAQQQEPVAWQILNGVCHAGIRSTEDLAKEAAAGMQKTHDLGGSLAAFHVRPLYTSPPASKPWVGLTDEEVEDLYFDGFSMSELKQFARAIEAKLREKNTPQQSKGDA